MERRGDCRRQNWAEFWIENLSTRAADTGSAARLRYAASLCRAAPLIIAAPFSTIMIVGALVLVGDRWHYRGVDDPHPIEPMHTHSSTAATVMQEQLVG
jgi:hypothetical protein